MCSQKNDGDECDEDGWTLRVNNEPKTKSFVLTMSPTLINHVNVNMYLSIYFTTKTLLSYELFLNVQLLGI